MTEIRATNVTWHESSVKREEREAQPRQEKSRSPSRTVLFACVHESDERRRQQHQQQRNPSRHQPRSFHGRFQSFAHRRGSLAREELKKLVEDA